MMQSDNWLFSYEDLERFEDNEFYRYCYCLKK